MLDTSCPFCSLPRSRVIDENHHGLLIRDGFPVSPGHSLVIPRRHILSLFDTSADELSDLFSLLNRAKQVLASEFHPDGYNVGINDGAAAGQTVPHLHIHLIPRFFGDLSDPRGGVRWVIPEKADYWSERKE